MDFENILLSLLVPSDQKHWTTHKNAQKQIHTLCTQLFAIKYNSPSSKKVWTVLNIGGLMPLQVHLSCLKLVWQWCLNTFPASSNMIWMISGWSIHISFCTSVICTPGNWLHTIPAPKGKAGWMMSVANNLL